MYMTVHIDTYDAIQALEDSGWIVIDKHCSYQGLREALSRHNNSALNGLPPIPESKDIAHLRDQAYLETLDMDLPPYLSELLETLTGKCFGR